MVASPWPTPGVSTTTRSGPDALAGGQQVVEVLGDRAAGRARGQAAEEDLVAAEGVHPDPVAEQRAAALAPRRVDGQDDDAQLVLLVQAQPAQQLVGEAGLARAAGAGDAEDGHVAPGPAQRRGELGVAALLQDGERPGQRGGAAGQDVLDRRRLRGQVDVARAHQGVDHAGEAEPLPVLRREDRDAAAAQQRDLLGDDDAAAAAEHLHVAGADLLEALLEVAEVLDVAALVAAHGDALRVLLQGRGDDLLDAAVVAEVHDLRALALQHPPHDVDRGVVPVEQAGGGHEPHRVRGLVQGGRVGHVASRGVEDVTDYLDVLLSARPGSPQGKAGRLWTVTATASATVPAAASAATSAARPVVAVANRLPVHRGADGWELSPGGLVTALRPVMESRSGTWVGWDGGESGAPERLPSMSIDLEGVALSADDVAGYYHGFANRTLWPLLHDAVEKPVLERAWWTRYRAVNEAFAEAAVHALRDQPDALLWVHDYHLVLVPELVRRALPEQRSGFFLHVPWPSPDLYARLPWRADLLRGLLGADVVSFHTEAYRRNFVRSVVRHVGQDLVEARGSVLALRDGREVRTTAAPISIDAAQYGSAARSSEALRELALLEEQFAGRTVLLGVDRLDYTKGIVERLLAVELLLERRPDLRSSLVFVQVAVPSRDDVQEYRDLRATVEQTIGRINGRFTEPGADVPVHYLYRGLPQEHLAAYYARADALLVTPLMDGMNLVAKEYVVVQQALRRSGALVLSEFTGAAAELREATRCNPFDVEGLSRVVEGVLEQPESDRRAALTAMARRVRTNDVHRWVDRQLRDLAG